MKHKGMAVLAGVLIVVGVTGAVATGAFLYAHRAGGGRSRVDAMFIEQMIPHHEDAIEMAELAETRAEHPELRRLAEDIKQNQTAENEQMREWYEQWYSGRSPEEGASSGMMGGMMDGMMRDMTVLSELENAEQFDREFIEQMIPHHRMAIRMARMLERSTERPEMRELARSIIERQTAEIEEMRGWHERWYSE